MMLIDIEPILDAAELAGKEYVSIDFLKGFEQVDAVPVVHGEWLFIANGVEDPECSVCGWAVLSRDFKNRSDLPPYHKYCGHCGAKMEDT
jgi:hypothetical protein